MTVQLGAVTIDCADPRKLAEFWTEALGSEVVVDHGGEYLLLTPASPDGVMIGLQRVEQPRDGKSRVHLDLRTEDRAAEVKRLVALGAKEVEEHHIPGLAWTVLTDPEDNVFCVGSAE
ncbi:VOC family protein [Amycolatopsis magusensis]|uniref:Catechol 2,3-dioxygenase-like lactoylglutathione lyase family enzyme n=1 Tax=Amycolatopsis magusensis TaxID=882444 RepID=A0ABS4Q3W3_9PSEU|nr:VOC family protein [Amycolatopsis magusensis]MBP2186372.1 catechol 2,3-dioxygenase-like lactoylglutathione lyase family enzyme [Amycolatopsis magusensis]